jgi:signal transduction histidine kinase
MDEPTLVESKASRWSVRALLLAWSVPVALAMPLSIVSLRGSGQTVALWRVLLIVGASWYVWAAMTPLIVRLADRRQLERPLTVGVIATHLAAAVVACTVQALTSAVATQVLAPPSGASLGGVFIYWLLLLLPAGVVVYAAVVGLRTAEVNRAALLARERQAQRLAAQLSEAQLSALRAQLQPHFLFNTLNAVIALVRDREADEAAQALTTLSSLLRTALRTGATHEVTLGEELTFTTNYLAIERMRYGDRLGVGVRVPETLGDARVPSFLLQPFVENALRHGLRHQPNGGCVDIAARIEGNQLIVTVEDNGVGLSTDWEERIAAGFGIANARARLRQLYGSNASLDIRRRSDGHGTVVQVALPLRRSMTQPDLGATSA